MSGYERLTWWSRRQALAMGLVASAGVVGLGSGLASTGNRATVALGLRRDLDKRFDAIGSLRFPELQATLVRYASTAESRILYPESTPGLLLLRWKCPHLGCTVIFCDSSGWFECPCHGSRFNSIGEYRFGPAPRGLDRIPVRTTADGQVVVDPRQRVLGPPRGASVVASPPQGPHCVG